MRAGGVILRLLPLLVPVALVFGCGVAVTLLQSVGLLMFSYRYEDLWFAYRELLADPWFYRSAGYSLAVALASSTISCLLGTLLAYGLWKMPEKLRRYGLIYKIPLILPHIVVGFLATLVLAKTGVLAAVAYRLGLIASYQDFPQLLYSATGLDLIAAYVYKETPFVILMVYAMLARFDQRQAAVARMLGAGRARVFLTLILPFVLPAINTTFLILFVFTLGGFDLPFVIGDSSPGMISLRVYEVFFHRDLAERPMAMAMLSLLLIFSLGFLVLYLRLSARLAREVRKV